MNHTNDNRFTTELFANRDAAERAYQTALKDGYTDDDINVIMSEDSKNKYYSSPLADKAEANESLEGAGVGGAVGAAVGGTLAAVAAVGTSLAIPGLGLIVAGPIAAGLAGAGAGGVTGGLVGALVGWGIPEDKAKSYEKGIKDGGIVLAVEDKKTNSRLSDEWRQFK